MPNYKSMLWTAAIAIVAIAAAKRLPVVKNFV